MRMLSGFFPFLCPPLAPSFGHFVSRFTRSFQAHTPSGYLCPDFRGSFGSMKLKVFAMTEKHKIFNSIIFSIIVYMMYIFSRQQWSANIFFHNDAVDGSGRVIDTLMNVSGLSLILVFKITIPRTKGFIGELNTRKISKKFFSAIVADNFYLFRSSHVMTSLRTIFTRSINSLVSRKSLSTSRANSLHIRHYLSEKDTAQPFNFALVEGAPLRMAGGDKKLKRGLHPRQLHYITGGVV